MSPKMHAIKSSHELQAKILLSALGAQTIHFLVTKRVGEKEREIERGGKRVLGRQA